MPTKENEPEAAVDLRNVVFAKERAGGGTFTLEFSRPADRLTVRLIGRFPRGAMRSVLRPPGQLKWPSTPAEKIKSMLGFGPPTVDLNVKLDVSALTPPELLLHAMAQTAGATREEREAAGGRGTEHVATLAVSPEAEAYVADADRAVRGDSSFAYDALAAQPAEQSLAVLSHGMVLCAAKLLKGAGAADDGVNYRSAAEGLFEDSLMFRQLTPVNELRPLLGKLLSSD